MTRREGTHRRAPVIRIPVDRLPNDRRERDAILQEYVAERVPESVRSGDAWEVQLRTPPSADYYIDPRLDEGLSWWSRFASPTSVEDIPFAVWRQSSVQVSLSDAWTIASWSRLLATRDDADQPAPLVVLHVDDHNDLMSPRLARKDRALVDLVTGRPVDLYRPATVTAAVNSGAIGMGSFILPALVTGRQLHIRHLRRPTGRPGKPGLYHLIQVIEPDTLLAPGESRPAVRISEPNQARTYGETTVGTYSLTETPDDWLDDLPAKALILLHVDCDYFSNRYDGDSDWQTHLRIHDPPEAEVERSIDELCRMVRPIVSRVHDMTVAVSPGFFPAEYWQRTVEALLHIGTIRQRAKAKTRVEAGAVRLERGVGSSGHGAGRGSQYWHVFEADRRAGRIWIEQADDANLGPHASLTIELNQTCRGRGIGRVAYRLAAEASGYDEIWLHMRKSNVASRKAAEYAGFVVVDVPGQRQLTMRWKRSSPKLTLVVALRRW